MKHTITIPGILAGVFLLAAPTPAAVVYYGFDDGTLQGWSNNVPAGTVGEDYVSWQTSGSGGNNNGGRTVARSADHMVLESDYANRDAEDTTVKVLSSPPMSLDATSSVSAWTLGGTGAIETPTWNNYSDLPTSATSTGFMGLGLRRVSDGAYLLYDRRSGNGQSGRAINWLEVGWDATEIGAAIAGDALDETYQVDLIDTFSGGWGWIGMDDVTIVPEPGVTLLAGLLAPAVLLRRRRS